MKRTLVSFYDDQMTHHAAALTYYCLMSLFPAALLALSVLSLIGQYPETYDAIIGYLSGVVPDSALAPLNSSLREALQSKGTAVTALATSLVLTLYGTTGALEAARRALNVVFELDGGGRSFLRRKSIDIASTFVLMALVVASMVMLFLGGGFASDVFGFIGLGPTAATVWSVLRWPGCSSGSSPRPDSRSTSRRSPMSARSSAHSPGRSCSSDGYGSPTSRFYSAPSSTLRSSVRSSSTRACPNGRR
jgi:membrane protein